MIDVHSEEYILGQNIKKYRMLKRWTQSKLSEAVDIDRAEIPNMRAVKTERWDLRC